MTMYYFLNQNKCLPFNSHTQKRTKTRIDKNHKPTINCLYEEHEQKAATPDSKEHSKHVTADISGEFFS